MRTCLVAAVSVTVATASACGDGDRTAATGQRASEQSDGVASCWRGSAGSLQGAVDDLLSVVADGARLSIHYRALLRAEDAGRPRAAQTSAAQLRAGVQAARADARTFAASKATALEAVRSCRGDQDDDRADLVDPCWEAVARSYERGLARGESLVETHLYRRVLPAVTRLADAVDAHRPYPGESASRALSSAFDAYLPTAKEWTDELERSDAAYDDCAGV